MCEAAGCTIGSSLLKCPYLREEVLSLYPQWVAMFSLVGIMGACETRQYLPDGLFLQLLGSCKLVANF